MSRMKIVLKETVDKVGDAGDVVTVTGGYARNFLIPRGLAVPATKGNVRHAETWKNSKATKVAKAESDAVVTKGKLDGKKIRCRPTPVPMASCSGPSRPRTSPPASASSSVSRSTVTT